MQESYRFRVTGLVQGVGFRVAAQRKALFLGLRGWVRNREDGAVEGSVGGEVPGDLALFRDWLRRGPPNARVEVLDWTLASEAVDDESFMLRR